MPTLKTKLKEVAGGAAEELEVQIKALYEAVKEKSETKAKEIKAILAKVSMVLYDLADKKISQAEANMALKSYRQAVYSKGRALENFAKWETYKSMWATVKILVKSIIGLLV
jgi:hypothetical protein